MVLWVLIVLLSQACRVGQEDLALQEIPEGLGFQVFLFFLGVLEDQEVLLFQPLLVFLRHQEPPVVQGLHFLR